MLVIIMLICLSTAAARQFSVLKVSKVRTTPSDNIPSSLGLGFLPDLSIYAKLYAPFY